MSEKSRELIIYLLSVDEYITVEELSFKFAVSERTIYSYLSEIDLFLKDINLKPLKRVKNKGILCCFNDSERHKIIEKMVLSSYQSYSPQNRCKRIIKYLLNYDGFSTVEEISKLNDVSRNTTLNDLKDLETYLEKTPVKILMKPFEGVRLIGKEVDKRKLFVEILSMDLDDQFLETYLIINELLSISDVKNIEKIIGTLENDFSKILSGQEYKEAKINLALSVNRVRKNHIIENLSLPINISITQEYKILKSLQDMINKVFNIKMPDVELEYIALQLIGSNVKTGSKELAFSEIWLPLQMAVLELIQNVENDLVLDLSTDKDLFEGLVLHMRPAYYRMLNGEKQVNPLLEEIEKTYGYLSDLVEDNLHIMEERLDIKFTRDEASYITMYFASSIERQKKTHYVRPKIVLVCAEGLSTSRILKTQIEQKFDFNILAVLDVRSLDDFLSKHNVDYIISTVNIARKGQKVLRVNPILSSQDLKKLSKIDYGNTRELDLDQLILIIEKSANIDNQEQLLKDITDYMCLSSEESNIRKERQLMLEDVLTENLIKAKAKIKSREEAIIKSGQLLLEAGLIEERYIEAMLKNLEVNGTYIVIAPGIAIPHARPEEGVNDVGFSIVTLEEPVLFGHEKNDPVSIVIGFCAVDQHSHLRALSDLVEILSEEKSVERIIQAENEKEIMNIIRGGI